ncbi:MAG: hypothetical protein WBB28_01230 [Crinalium sp.]
MNENSTESTKRVFESLRQSQQQVFRAAQQLISKITAAAREFYLQAEKLHEIAWTKYVEAGCPIGETYDGLLVWFDVIRELGLKPRPSRAVLTS